MRLFIAINLDENLKAVIADLQRNLQSKIKLKTGRFKLVDPELMHLTLKFLGEVEPDKVDQVGEIVTEATAKHKSFSFDVPVLGCFGRPVKVIWLGSQTENQQLLKLHQDIEDALDSAKWPKEQRPFSPHLTVARLKNATADRAVKDVIKNYPPLNSAQIMVDSVLVYQSQLTPTGPIYTALSETKLK